MYHLTTAILRVKREPLPKHFKHLTSPRDPQLAQGILPLPLQVTHLQKENHSVSSQEIYKIYLFHHYV